MIASNPAAFDTNSIASAGARPVIVAKARASIGNSG
jgi:hypothetical protein